MVDRVRADGLDEEALRDLYDLEFTDERRGWAITAERVLFSADGGRLWQTRLNSPGSMFKAVCATDGGDIWATGDGVIWMSHDEGVTWRRVAEEGTWYDICFVSAREGWMVGAGRSAKAPDFTIMHTSDGGMSWAPQLELENGRLWAVCAVDAHHVWAVGGSAEGAVIYATTDGGRTWSRQPSPFSAALQDLTFLDRRRGWAVGSTGTILATTDGGRHWRLQRKETAEKEFLKAVSFADARHGWAVGWVPQGYSPTARIVKTSDGGRHWEYEVVPAEAEDVALSSVWFESVEDGWVGGGDGILLRRR